MIWQDSITKIDRYINEMQNAEGTPIWAECQAAAKNIYLILKK